jgi:hypothetical protein
MMKHYIRDECPKTLIALYTQEGMMDENTKYKSAFNDLFLYSELKKDIEFVAPIGDINHIHPLKELNGGQLPGLNTNPIETVCALSDALAFSSLTSFYRRSDMPSNHARYKAYEIIQYPKLNMFSSYVQNRVWNRIDNLEELNMEDFPNLIAILNKKEYWGNKAIRSAVRYKSTEPLDLNLTQEQLKHYTTEFKFDPENSNVHIILSLKIIHYHSPNLYLDDDQITF